MGQIERELLAYARDNGGLTTHRPARIRQRLVLPSASLDDMALRQTAKGLEAQQYLEILGRGEALDGREATHYIVTPKGRAAIR